MKFAYIYISHKKTAAVQLPTTTFHKTVAVWPPTTHLGDLSD